jgi:hypothetical protein
MSFKPKPIMHYEKDVEESERAFVIVKPCGFCNQGFHYMMLLLLHANKHFTHSLVEILLHVTIVYN